MKFAGEGGGTIGIHKHYLFIVTIVSVSALLAIKGRHLFYWFSALGIYVFSFLAGFSVGQITVSLTFIPLFLAMGYSFRWIKRCSHVAIFLCSGILTGFLLTVYAEDEWLFYPFYLFYPVLSLLSDLSL
ncbi:hypothetical protein [Sporolactobacillus sp. THM19-2]|jgi:hypothetical protein|uniref:hypothetical protein n=1 Tax=Sporolactobacillus sp. THM19-2 TaxID=2511171 RepID=UPI001F0E7D2C|nr:hypothetical protein [Sporolactobacillus sp. THM19-2]